MLELDALDLVCVTDDGTIGLTAQNFHTGEQIRKMSNMQSCFTVQTFLKSLNFAVFQFILCLTELSLILLPSSMRSKHDFKRFYLSIKYEFHQTRAQNCILDFSQVLGPECL